MLLRYSLLVFINVTLLYFLLHRSKPAITSSVDSCEFVVSWPTSLACPPRTVPCAVEVNGSLYDLSPLHLPRGYWDAIVPADSTYRYLINICGPVDDFKLNQSANCSNGMTAVCQVRGFTPFLGYHVTLALSCDGSLSVGGSRLYASFHCTCFCPLCVGLTI